MRKFFKQAVVIMATCGAFIMLAAAGQVASPGDGTAPPRRGCDTASTAPKAHIAGTAVCILPIEAAADDAVDES